MVQILGTTAWLTWAKRLCRLRENGSGGRRGHFRQWLASRSAANVQIFLFSGIAFPGKRAHRTSTPELVK